MELNLGQWVVIGVCAILILGYIRGYYYNRQRAGQILRLGEPEEFDHPEDDDE